MGSGIAFRGEVRLTFQDQIAGLYARIDKDAAPGRLPSMWAIREQLRQLGRKQPSTTRLYAWKDADKPVLPPMPRLLDLCDAAGLTVAERNGLIVEWALESSRMEVAGKPAGEVDNA